MSEPNPITDVATANAGSGGRGFAGWLVGSIFWPMVRLSFGTGANSYEVDNVNLQRLPVMAFPQGSVGLGDHSVGQVALPNIGANFPGTGVYANYNLLATIALNLNRTNVEIQNNSANQILIVRDDGTAAGGAAPVNASAFALSPGGVQGGQGGAYASHTFKGRIQIYAVAGTTQIVAFEE